MLPVLIPLVVAALAAKSVHDSQRIDDLQNQLDNKR